jgi:RNA exonuclease 4
MKVSYHSVHEPRCGVCQKHCRSFESLREHLTGELLFHMRSNSEYCVFVLIHLLICFLDFYFFNFLYRLGPLPNANCSKIFSEQGCNLCLKVLDSPSSLCEHKKRCCLSAPTPIVSLLVRT